MFKSQKTAIRRYLKAVLFYRQNISVIIKFSELNSYVNLPLVKEAGSLRK